MVQRYTIFRHLSIVWAIYFATYTHFIDLYQDKDPILPQFEQIKGYIGTHLITPIWAACKAIFDHFTRYAAPTAGATRRASGTSNETKSTHTEEDTETHTKDRRNEPRKGRRNEPREGKNEGAKYYNKSHKV